MNRRQLSNMAFGIEETDVAGNITDIETNLATADSEVIELGDQAASAEHTMNTLVNDEHTLQEMYGVVQEGLEATDGIDSSTAEVIQEALENMYKRHGLRRRIANRISKESFGGYNKRRATEELKMSLEGFLDTIKEGIKKIWEWIKGLWRKIFGANDKKLETLEEMVDWIIANAKKWPDGTYVEIPGSNGEGSSDIDTVTNALKGKADLLATNYKSFIEQLSGLVSAGKLKPVVFEKLNGKLVFGNTGTATVSSPDALGSTAGLLKSIVGQLGQINDMGRNQVEGLIAKLEEKFGNIDKEVDEKGQPKEGTWLSKAWANFKEVMTKERHIPGVKYGPKPADILKDIKTKSALLVNNSNTVINAAEGLIKGIAKGLKGNVSNGNSEGEE